LEVAICGIKKQPTSFEGSGPLPNELFIAANLSILENKIFEIFMDGGKSANPNTRGKDDPHQIPPKLKFFAHLIVPTASGSLS
jgi:hypothetical protein